MHNHRRKSRSQTVDNMDKWKSSGGKSQRRREEERKSKKRKSQKKEDAGARESEKRREEKKKEDQRKERVRRKKMQVREKVEKSRNTAFFQCFAAPGGRKVGSLKWRVRSHLARWEIKNCTLLWREAHLAVKMYKAHHAGRTVGSWNDGKVHAVVARTCRGQIVKRHHVRTTFGR